MVIDMLNLIFNLVYSWFELLGITRDMDMSKDNRVDSNKVMKEFLVAEFDPAVNLFVLLFSYTHKLSFLSDLTGDFSSVFNDAFRSFKSERLP